MSIRTKILILYLSVAVTCTATLGGMVVAENQIRSALLSSQQAYTIMSEVSALVGLATEINKAGLQRVQRQWATKRSDLETAIDEHIGDQHILKSMRNELVQADTTFRELIQLMEREISSPPELDFSSARMIRYNHLTRLLSNLSSLAKIMGDQEVNRVQSVQRSRDFALLILACALCVVLSYVFYALWRGIRTPLSLLSKSIYRVSAGDLSHRTKVPNNNNEMANLIRLQNQMLDKLQKLTVSRQQLIDATDEERRRIGRELHDSISQTLVGCKLKISNLKSTEAEVIAGLEEITEHIKHALQEIQEIVLNLRPAMLDANGLVATLEWFSNQFNNGQHIALDFDLAEKEIQVNLGVTIFRIVQEATTNAFRHGKANTVHIQMIQNNDALDLFIEDDGQGFTPTTCLTGNGLINIQERVYAQSGELTIDSAPGRGCSIIASFPTQTGQRNDTIRPSSIEK